VQGGVATRATITAFQSSRDLPSCFCASEEFIVSATHCATRLSVEQEVFFFHPECMCANNPFGVCRFPLVASQNGQGRQLDERKTIKIPRIFAMDAPGVCGWRDSAFSGDFNGSMMVCAQQTVTVSGYFAARVVFAVLVCASLGPVFHAYSGDGRLSQPSHPHVHPRPRWRLRTPIRTTRWHGRSIKPGYGSADPANGVFSVETASRVFLLLSQGLIITGALALERVVKRRIQAAGFVAVMFLFGSLYSYLSRPAHPQPDAPPARRLDSSRRFTR
jgi:hypothetical protein